MTDRADLPSDYAQRWHDTRGYDATRELLRDAAHDMIRQRGLDELSMRGLAAHVGVSAMAAYRYFSGKDTLVEEVRRHVRRTFAARLTAAADTTTDPVERFRALCVTYLEYARANEQDYRLMFGADVPPPADVLEGGAREAPAWQALLRVIGDLPTPDRALGDVERAHLVWATLHGIVMLHLSQRLVFGLSIANLVEPSIDFLLRALMNSASWPDTEIR